MTYIKICEIAKHARCTKVIILLALIDWKIIFLSNELLPYISFSKPGLLWKQLYLEIYFLFINEYLYVLYIWVLKYVINRIQTRVAHAVDSIMSVNVQFAVIEIWGRVHVMSLY